MNENKKVFKNKYLQYTGIMCIALAAPGAAHAQPAAVGRTQARIMRADPAALKRPAFRRPFLLPAPAVHRHSPAHAGSRFVHRAWIHA